MHYVTIPEADLCRFCIHPLKWVRYLGFTIVGVSGDLSREANGGPIQSYTGATSRQLRGQYFYIADGQNIRPQCDGTHIHPTPNVIMLTHLPKALLHFPSLTSVLGHPGMSALMQAVQHSVVILSAHPSVHVMGRVS